MSETQHDRPALPPDIRAFFVVNYGNGDSFRQSPSPAPMVEYYGAYEPADRAAGLFNLLYQAPDTHEGWREAGVNVYDSANPPSAITAAIADVASRDEQTTAHLVNMLDETLRDDAENDLSQKLTTENVQLFVTRGWNTPGADPRAVARMLQFGRQQIGDVSDLFGHRMPARR